ncbi:MAG: DUF5805 domain-containing protein [Halorientalis sp.]
MADGEVDTDRTAVKTYVPAYQKAEWETHAAELDMTVSEFVRTMVQAGRRDFELDPVEPEDSDPDPGGQPLEERVLDILRERGPQSWQDLRNEVAGDIEDRLEGALEILQNENRITHSGRAGGYILEETDA